MITFILKTGSKITIPVNRYIAVMDGEFKITMPNSSVEKTIPIRDVAGLQEG